MDNNIKVPKQSTISIWSLEGMGSIWYHSIGSSLLVLYCPKTGRGGGLWDMWGVGEGWGVIGDLGSGSYGVGSTARRRVMTFGGYHGE